MNQLISIDASRNKLSYASWRSTAGSVAQFFHLPIGLSQPEPVTGLFPAAPTSLNPGARDGYKTVLGHSLLCTARQIVWFRAAIWGSQHARWTAQWYPWAEIPFTSCASQRSGTDVWPLAWKLRGTRKHLCLSFQSAWHPHKSWWRWSPQQKYVLPGKPEELWTTQQEPFGLKRGMRLCT